MDQPTWELALLKILFGRVENFHLGEKMEIWRGKGWVDLVAESRCIGQCCAIMGPCNVTRGPGPYDPLHQGAARLAAKEKNDF